MYERMHSREFMLMQSTINNQQSQSSVCVHSVYVPLSLQTSPGTSPSRLGDYQPTTDVNNRTSRPPICARTCTVVSDWSEIRTFARRSQSDRKRCEKEGCESDWVPRLYSTYTYSPYRAGETLLHTDHWPSTVEPKSSKKEKHIPSYQDSNIHPYRPMTKDQDPKSSKRHTVSILERRKSEDTWAWGWAIGRRSKGDEIERKIGIRIMACVCVRVERPRFWSSMSDLKKRERTNRLHWLEVAYV